LSLNLHAGVVGIGGLVCRIESTGLGDLDELGLSIITLSARALSIKVNSPTTVRDLTTGI